jgi:hypothetical protein
MSNSLFKKFKIFTSAMATSGGGGSSVWGTITGLLSSQTDLQSALDAKVDDSQVVTDFTVIDNATLPTTEAVNNQIIQASSGLTAYFFYKTLSTIVGTYYTMTKTPSVGVLRVITGTPSVPSGTKLTTFITNLGSPSITFIPSGVVKFHIHATQTGGTKVTQLYALLYKTNSTGSSPTLLATSGYSNVLTGVSAEYTVDTALSTSTTLLSTDLLMVEWYTFNIGGGSNPTVNLDIEDNTVARMELPSSYVDLSGYQPLLHSGTVNIDFGKDGVLSENDLVVTTVLASWVTSTTKIQCFVENDGVDHTGEDVYLENIMASTYNINVGVSFDIIAVAHNLTWGRYKITYKEII